MDKEQIVPIIIGKLLNIGGLLRREGNRMLLPFGLNQQQFSVFFEIAKVGKVKQKDMVNRLSLEKANVSKITKKLQEMELIVITADDDDKRSTWLSTTLKGEGTLEKCMKIFTEWNKQWFETLSDKQCQSILDSLTIVQTTLNKQIEKNNCTQIN